MSAQDWLNRRSHGAGIVELQLGKGPSNGLNAEFLLDFSAEIQSLAEDSAIQIILISSPFHSFCNGAEVSENSAEFADGVQSAIDALLSCGKPTIAVINGDILDAGLCLALACDSRIGVTKTGYGLPYVHTRRSPTAAEQKILHQKLDPNVARRLLLTGQTIGPVAARNYGIIDLVAEDQEDLWMFALREAKTFAAVPADHFAAVKKLLNNPLEATSQNTG